jgi:type II secretory ATPase GspE/PulE/Tfp pilus assembly ATPase PilB-like protein
MIAGTFNLVMAQRLSRKVCDKCKTEVNIKEQYPVLYKYATKALSDMDQEDLKKELVLRKINQEQWENFINK